MAVPRITVDGAQAYGVIVGSSGVITINAIVYKVNNVSINRASQEAKDYVPDGGPGRRRVTADFDSGTMELQLATGSTAYPKFGDQFTMQVDSNYGTETWYCLPVNVPQDNSAGAIRVIPLEFNKAYNTVSTVA